MAGAHCGHFRRHLCNFPLLAQRVEFHPLIRLPEFVVGLACEFWFIRAGLNPKLATPLILAGTAAA